MDMKRSRSRSLFSTSKRSTCAFREFYMDKGISNDSFTVIPKDVCAYIAQLCICTEYCIESDDSPMEYERVSNVYDELPYNDPSTLQPNGCMPEMSVVEDPRPLNMWYYQNYTKDYFRVSRKFAFLFKLYSTQSLWDVLSYIHDDGERSGRLSYELRIKREKLRLYKFWLICNIQIIP